MSPLSTTSLSGMQAAQGALDASARNIARLATGGFGRAQVDSATLASGGASSTLTQATQAGPRMEADMVDQLVAKNAFLANLAVFKTADQMLGTLLNAQG